MPAAVTRKLSRLHKPPDLSLDAWQRELRRQFGREQSFKVRNAGTEPVFSDFQFEPFWTILPQAQRAG